MTAARLWVSNVVFSDRKLVRSWPSLGYHRLNTSSQALSNMLQLTVTPAMPVRAMCTVRFERHCPEQTLLYHLVENYYLRTSRCNGRPRVGCYRIAIVRNSMST